MKDKKFYYRFLNRKAMSEYLISVDPSHAYLYEPDMISSRMIGSWIVGSIYADWFNENSGERHYRITTDNTVLYNSFSAIGSKRFLLKFVKFLWKNYRKAYYFLCGYYNEQGGREVKTFDAVIHGYHGSAGYLPNFSDKPDYYYIYC